jgi:hypothetical protein
MFRPGLEAREIAEILSQWIKGGISKGIWMSQSSWWIQASSAAVIARARYSASVEERETVCCFLEAQEIGLEPK